MRDRVRGTAQTAKESKLGLQERMDRLSADTAEEREREARLQGGRYRRAAESEAERGQATAYEFSPA